MKENNLSEAKILDAEIKELKYFIESLDVAELWRTNSNVKAFIKEHRNTCYSIFGSRHYGIGTRANTIDVPTSMIPSIVIQAKELLLKKETEFNQLFA